MFFYYGLIQELPAGAAGANATISGAGCVASAGTLSARISSAVSGAQVTAIAGGDAIVIGAPLAGAAATAQAGTVSFSNALNVSISGAQVLANAGLVSDGVAPGLVGAGSVAAAGALSEADILSVVGAAITAMAGSLADVVLPSAGGAQIVALAGSVSFSGSFFNAPVFGAAVTAQAGTVSVLITLAVTGVVNPLGKLKMYTGSLGSVSNQEDWIGNVSLMADDGTLFNMAGAVVEIFVTDPDLTKSSLLSGSVADGHIVIAGDGLTMTWHFSGGPNGEMSRICAGTYSCFCKLYLNGLWTQLFTASVSIVDGGPNS